MTSEQSVWFALILAQLVVALPFIAHLLFHRTPDMTISPAAQAIIDELTSATTALATALANAYAKATAQSTEDLAGIKTAADALVSAIDSAATPPPAALAVNPTAITGAVGAAISTTLTVSGGTAPYAYASNLADVSVDASGVVTGTPAAAETGAITVTDASGAAVDVSVTVS